jgi:serine/threonine-protein kinase
VGAALGMGGMGVVYDGIDGADGKPVAIKVVKRNISKEMLARFQFEATTAAKVRHRHLCIVHHMGVSEEGLPFLVMERLTGETIRKRLARVKRFSAADTVAVGVQLLEALAAVHAAGVLHRDVKPANIIITTPDSATPLVKLIDFGLARLLRSIEGATQQREITRVGVIPGTPAYLTPEQLRGERDLDEGVDVWGAALTIFEMLTGFHAFKAATREELARNIVTAPLPPLTSFVNDVPRELEIVLEKALARRRSERWRTATEFRQALVEAWARHRIAAVRRGSDLLAGKGVEIDMEPTQLMGGPPFKK